MLEDPTANTRFFHPAGGEPTAQPARDADAAKADGKDPKADGKGGAAAPAKPPSAQGGQTAQKPPKTDAGGAKGGASVKNDENENTGGGRSSGGRGVHVFLLWAEPQDARSVRLWLAGLLAGAPPRVPIDTAIAPSPIGTATQEHSAMTRWAVFAVAALGSMLGTTSLALADPPGKAAIEADKRYYEAEREYAKERQKAYQEADREARKQFEEMQREDRKAAEEADREARKYWDERERESLKHDEEMRREAAKHREEMYKSR